MFLWDFADILDALVDWAYEQTVGLLGEFFAWMGNMGADLFGLDPVRAVVLFFSYLGWALFAAGLAVSVFETAIEYQGGRGNLKDAALNAIKGMMAALLFSAAPVELYSFSVSLQSDLTIGITGLGSLNSLGSHIVDNLRTPGVDGAPSGAAFAVVVMAAYAIVKVFLGNLKRGGILLTQIAVGSFYMFSIPRGYSDGFLQWMKQIIGLCLTAFLQSVLLTIGLMVLPDHSVLGVGIMLSAGEVPRIAGAFGLETSARASIAGALHTVQAAVGVTQTIARAVK
jgi:hypothetical protein